MRGALRLAAASEVVARIIPADAGSTFPLGRYPTYIWDHPRGCGEHDAQRSDLLKRDGSSPRMRGAQSSGTLPCNGGRIIPADAGSTADSATWHPSCGDHPRGCGEHLNMAATYRVRRGSSPRMRGARLMWSYLYSALRIIPADAGSTQEDPAIIRP